MTPARYGHSHLSLIASKSKVATRIYQNDDENRMTPRQRQAPPPGRIFDESPHSGRRFRRSRGDTLVADGRYFLKGPRFRRRNRCQSCRRAVGAAHECWIAGQFSRCTLRPPRPAAIVFKRWRIVTAFKNVTSLSEMFELVASSISFRRH